RLARQHRLLRHVHAAQDGSQRRLARPLLSAPRSIRPLRSRRWPRPETPGADWLLPGTSHLVRRGRGGGGGAGGRGGGPEQEVPQEVCGHARGRGGAAALAAARRPPRPDPGGRPPRRPGQGGVWGGGAGGFGGGGGGAGGALLAGEGQHLVVRRFALLTMAAALRTPGGPAGLCEQDGGAEVLAGEVLPGRSQHGAAGGDEAGVELHLEDLGVGH
ncbi:hypothetical protein CRUP_014239, partial [Coryphaenoides rupestris]